jgi:hypothetical protein
MSRVQNDPMKTKAKERRETKRVDTRTCFDDVRWRLRMRIERERKSVRVCVKEVRKRERGVVFFAGTSSVIPIDGGKDVRGI